MPAIRIGKPTMAYSKKPKLCPVASSRTDCPIMLPGAPIRERLPPIAAANTSGIRSLDLLKPDFAAIPMTTGIRMAAVPVLERTPLISPTISMMAMIRLRSVFANFVTRPPILFAIPVSNSAPPTTNIATNRMTLLSIKPAKASFHPRTPVTISPTHTIMEVKPSGIFSVTNITMANARNKSVIIAGFIYFSFSSQGQYIINDHIHPSPRR